MDTISQNIKRIRKVKKLSQKEIALTIDIPQGQYSRIESGKVVPTIPTLQKIADVFEVTVADLVSETHQEDQQANLPILEKVKMISLLEKDEKEALMTLIDMAISRKVLKDNLSQLAAS